MKIFEINAVNSILNHASKQFMFLYVCERRRMSVRGTTVFCFVLPFFFVVVVCLFFVFLRPSGVEVWEKKTP